MDERRRVATTVRPACARGIVSVSARRSRAARRGLRGEPRGRCRRAGSDVGAPRGGRRGPVGRRRRTPVARTAGRGGVSLDRAVASRRSCAPGRALAHGRRGDPRDRGARPEGSMGLHPARMAVGAVAPAAGSAARFHRRPASAGDGGGGRRPSRRGSPTGPPAGRGAPARHRQGIRWRSHRGRRRDRHARLSADGVSDPTTSRRSPGSSSTICCSATSRPAATSTTRPPRTAWRARSGRSSSSACSRRSRKPTAWPRGRRRGIRGPPS